MRVEDCKPGVRVRYSPIIGGAESYLGTVSEEPWQLGHGAWVTHLNMEEAYHNWTGRSRATGVLVVEALELAEVAQ